MCHASESKEKGLDASAPQTRTLQTQAVGGAGVGLAAASGEAGRAKGRRAEPWRCQDARVTGCAPQMGPGQVGAVRRRGPSRIYDGYTRTL